LADGEGEESLGERRGAGCSVGERGHGCSCGVSGDEWDVGLFLVFTAYIEPRRSREKEDE
jgi:hypothetical protein